MTILYHSHESLFSRWQGTVLPRAWKLTLFTGVLSFFLCTVYNEHRQTVKRGGSATFSFHLFHDAESFFGMATTFVTFILGFFNASVFGRWWKLRELVGTLIERSVDTSRILTADLDCEDSASREIVHELVRYLALGLAVSLQAACGEDTAEDLDKLCLKDFKGRKLLQKDGIEYAILKESKAANYNVVYGWFLKKLAQTIPINKSMRPSEYIRDKYMMTVSGQLLREAAGEIMMYKNTPIPLAYTHLLEVFVKIYVLTAPVALALYSCGWHRRSSCS